MQKTQGFRAVVWLDALDTSIDSVDYSSSQSVDSYSKRREYPGVRYHDANANNARVHSLLQ